MIFVLIGLFVGLHSASWGAYKDSPYEGFSKTSYLRSIFIALILSIPFAIFDIKALGLITINAGIFFAVVMLMERFITECYKVFFRKQTQSKYRISPQFSIKGKVEKDLKLKLIIFILFCLWFWFGFRLPYLLQVDLGSHLLTSIFWGGLTGLLGPAISGSYKDAHAEGFSLRTFSRSIILGLSLGGILSFFTLSYPLLGMAVNGSERMFAELYKTFIRRKRRPGKFKESLPVSKDWIKNRLIFFIPYALSWILFIILFQYQITI